MTKPEKHAALEAFRLAFGQELEQTLASAIADFDDATSRGAAFFDAREDAIEVTMRSLGVPSRGVL